MIMFLEEPVWRRKQLLLGLRKNIVLVNQLSPVNQLPQVNQLYQVHQEIIKFLLSKAFFQKNVLSERLHIL